MTTSLKTQNLDSLLYYPYRSYPAMGKTTIGMINLTAKSSGVFLCL